MPRKELFSLRRLIDIVKTITHVWSGPWRDGRRGRFALGNDAECGSRARLEAARLFRTVAVGSTARGLADDQFGFDNGFAAAGVGSGSPDAAQQSLGGNSAHFAQRLSHRGERRILVSGALNVVEAHHRNILGYA